MGGESLPFVSKTPTMHGVSPSKPAYTSNYEYMRFNSGPYPDSSSTPSLMFSQQAALGNQGTYLNIPFSSSKSFSQEPNYPKTYSLSNVQSSPLPPPPPLPTYAQPHPNGSQVLLQPTPQQPQPGQYLDLSLNRENRGSAFEVYRKPVLDSMHQPLLNESQMFQGLPPPPPPLTVNDIK